MIDKKKGKLVILSAPSGCGKTTVSEQLIKNPLIVKSISATTRAPRVGEKHGVDYYFLSNEEFQKNIDDDKFVEHAKYHDNCYGTLIDPLIDYTSNGLTCLLIIEVKGALQIKEKYPDCISIFLLPPSTEVLRERLSNRKTESSVDVDRRLEIAVHELQEKERYDFCVVNDDINNAVSDILKIIM